MSSVRCSIQRARYYATSTDIAGPHSYEVTQRQYSSKFCILTHIIPFIYKVSAYLVTYTGQ